MKKWICIVLLGVSVLAFSGTTVFADEDEDTKEEDSNKGGSDWGSYVQGDNNGEAKDEPIGDSKIPSSFNDCEYYDCYIPYKLVPNDIGGWCTGVTNTKYDYGPMSQSSIENCHMGGYVNYQWNHQYSSAGTAGYDPDTGCSTVTDENGVTYFETAVQGFFYNASVAGTGDFPAWNTKGQKGQIFDVILTDGTVIHFILADCNSNSHTNGGTAVLGEDGAPSADGIWSYADMKLEQYYNLYAAMSGNQLEIWGKSGCAKKFADKFGLGTGEDSNKIAYYRMYNKNVASPPKPANDKVKASSFNLSELGNAPSSNGGSEEDGLGGLPIGGTARFAETHFVKWKIQETENQEFPFEWWLADNDIQEVENWKADLEKDNSESILIRGGRFVSIFFGIIFEVWMMLIYLSYWFDRLNNFFDFSLLSVLTFGRLRISPDESECTFAMTDLGKGDKRTVNHKKILEVCVLGLSFGALIVSGAIFEILQGLVNAVLSWLY